MASPIFSLLGNQANNSSMNNLLSQFQAFKSTFQGNPKAQVQQLLNSGRMTQAQFNQLSQMANQFQQMLK